MKKIILCILKKYKRNISPILSSHGIKCKFYPTCSEYAYQAIEKYGIIKGCLLTIKRLLRCNPFSKGGYDPLK